MLHYFCLACLLFFVYSVLYNLNQEGIVMFRLWAKEFQENRMIRDMVSQRTDQDTRTHKIFAALDEICDAFDLAKPIWLDQNIQEFKMHRKTRFTQDNFVESISFDYLEIQIIDE